MSLRRPLQALTLAFALAQPVQAGPTTTLITGQRAEALQATFNNSWNQSFAATGTTAASSGEATIHPFASRPSAAAAAAIPATLVEAVIELVPAEASATATAVAGYSARAGQEGPAGSPRPITTLSLGQLRLVASPSTQLETITGERQGQTIGSESLSVFGRSDAIPSRRPISVFWF